MQYQDILEVINCLPREATVFSYARKDYALRLLQNVLAHDGASLPRLKRSRFAGLLSHPAAKDAAAACGSGRLTPAALARRPKAVERDFILTLSKWGGYGERDYFQTSREGYNLVLQLNFPAQHDAEYSRLVKPKKDALFNYRGHPVLRRGQREFFFETLAWSRIDADLTTGTALIEEIQSDWVRYCARVLWIRHCRKHKRDGRLWAAKMAADRFAFADYVRYVLKPYEKQWAETMMMASMDFIRRELGINTIFYHSHETGHWVKGIQYVRPPRSIYSSLPKQFCFQPCDEGPAFLNEDRVFKKRLRQAPARRWYRWCYPVQGL